MCLVERTGNFLDLRWCTIGEFKNFELKGLFYIYIFLNGMALLPSESLIGSDNMKNVLLAIAIPKD